MHVRSRAFQAALVACVAASPIVACVAEESSSEQHATNGDAGTAEEAGRDGSSKPRVLRTPSHGSTTALSIDDDRLVVVGQDTDTVSVFEVSYPEGEPPALRKTGEVTVEGEPWQVALHPNGRSAFVIARKAQKLVRIDGLDQTPVLGGEVATGSEPTGIAMEPTGRAVWITNWNDGTVDHVDTSTLARLDTIDLNLPLVEGGWLGAKVAARPALAHPRAIAITNNGDALDDDETLYIAEFSAQQKEPLAPDGANADTAKVGIVYKIPVRTKEPSLIELPAMKDTGFADAKGRAIGCYPNQIETISIQGGFGYVVSNCASPRGPLGIFTGPALAACSSDAACPGALPGSCAAGKCTTNCTADAECGANGGVCKANVCAPNPAKVKATNAPVVSVIDLGGSKTIATVNLNQEFDRRYVEEDRPDDATRRLPLRPLEIAFVPGTMTAYLPANGADAVFRVDFDETYEAAAIRAVGTPKAPFIPLAPGGIDPSRVGRLPTGMAVNHLPHPAGSEGRYGFVANEATRNVQVLDLSLQALAGLAEGAPVASAYAPMPSSEEERRVLSGKRLFFTGLGRWSWKGQGWLACVSCHVDGLSDNVTWFHFRGPRQATSLDGTYASKDPSDFRINGWNASFDEPTDHEGAVRNMAGGVGAIIKEDGLTFASRMNFDGMGHGGLNGSSWAAADPDNPAGLATPSVSDDWKAIASWLKTLRSPRRPTRLDAAKVDRGKSLYVAAGCPGCHSGAKWTISRLFYQPDSTGTRNLALQSTSWSSEVASAGFPTSLLPTATPALRMMRYAGTNKALDQITCMLRPVGTFGVAEPEVGVAELKTDMTQVAQGNEADGNGYNPPSLLGLSVGAPYFHAGQARTLEAVFSDRFRTHATLFDSTFLAASDPDREAKVTDLVQYLLSIDEDTPVIAIPPLGAQGGDFCRGP